MKLVDDSWTKEKLYAECKRRGMAGCSALAKDGLIRTLNQAPPVEDMAPKGKGSTRRDTGINGLTVKELKAECKQRGLRKYAILLKDELVTLLEEDKAPAAKASASVDVDISELSMKELKAECNRRGLRNYSTLNKDELVALLEGKPKGGKGARARDGGDGRGQGKEKPGGAATPRSSRNNGKLQPIAQTAFDGGPTGKDEPGSLYVYSERGGVKNEWKVGMNTQDPPQRRIKDSERKNNTIYELKQSWPVCLPKYADKIVHAELHEYALRRKLKEGGREWADGGKELFQVDYGFLEARILLVRRMIAASYP